MKKLYVLAVVLLASVLIAEAGQVNEQQAREKAKMFMTKRSLTRGVSALQRVYMPQNTPSAMASVNEAPLYLFNLDGGGYVIVSGDDRTTEILGFSERGHIDVNKMPSNMKNWLNGYVKKIQKLPANAVPQQRATTRAAKADLQPKLKTTWGQDWPYNLHTPELFVKWDGNEATVNAATGCIATAMAQLLNYYRYPDATLKGAESYSGVADVPVGFSDVSEDTVQVAWETEAMLAGTPIDWANITDTYTQASTDAQIEAVSRLMQWCGLAANMQYGMESSARTDSLTYALYETFGYEDVYLLHQRNYDAQGWIDVIYDVIAQEGPLLFGGDCPDDNGAHQFILDGYRNVDGTDYFYVNWGWDGEDDGYIALDVMRPNWIFDDDGNEIGFTEAQVATPGMGPNGKGVEATDKRWYCDFILVGYDDVVYERMSENEGFDVDYAFYFSNYDFPHTAFMSGLGIYKDDQLVSGMAIYDGYDLPLWYYIPVDPEEDTSLPLTISIGEGLGDGVYQVKMLCCVDGEDNWVPCRDGDDVNLVTMTIESNKATFKYGTQPTGIESVVNSQADVQKAHWHNLSGMRLNGTPSTKGIYINNGKKLVIK